MKPCSINQPVNSLTPCKVSPLTSTSHWGAAAAAGDCAAEAAEDAALCSTPVPSPQPASTNTAITIASLRTAFPSKIQVDDFTTHDHPMAATNLPENNENDVYRPCIVTAWKSIQWLRV